MDVQRYTICLKKRRRTKLLISVVILVVLLGLLFVPRNLIVAILIINGGFVWTYMMLACHSLAVAIERLNSGDSQKRIITIKEMSLGGHNNYFLAEGEEKEFVAYSVYGNVRVGDQVLVINHPSGLCEVVNTNSLKR